MPIRPFRLLRLAGPLALLISGTAAPASFLDGLGDLGSGAHTWEGAIGLVASYAPDYLGAADYGIGLRPALFLRYGRFTLTTGAGFTTARADQVERGLGADLVLTDQLRLTLAARVDGGRDESASPALAGMGDIDATIRARFSATWRPEPGWLLLAALSIDALGHGEGALVDLSFAREVLVAPKTYWTWGGSMSLADQKYMQTWYGVTPAQSTSSGYTVYTPSAGLRSVALSTGLRSDFVQDWVGFVNLGVSQALGPVLDSPLTLKPFGWGLNAGLAWRF